MKKNRFSKTVLAALSGLMLLTGASGIHLARAADEAAAPSAEERWKALSEQEREAIRANFRDWKALAPEKKAGIRRAYGELGRMSPEERQKVVANFQKFKSLPPEQQQKIRVRFEKFMKLSPEARKARLEKLKDRRAQIQEKLENRRERRLAPSR